MTRFVNSILVLVILIGGIALVKKMVRRNVLASEQKRLEKKTGIGNGVGPMFATRIEVDDPLAFRWRIRGLGRFSECKSRIVIHGCRMSGVEIAGSANLPNDYFVNFKFKFSSSVLHLMEFGGTTDGAGGGRSQIVQDRELVEFLREHWNELLIEEIDTEGDTLLRFRINYPADLMPQWNARFRKRIAEQKMAFGSMAIPFEQPDSTFAEVFFGTPDAIEPFLSDSVKE